MQFPFDVDLRALPHVLGDVLGRLSPRHDVVIFDLFLLLVVLVDPSLVGRDGERANTMPAWRGLDLGVAGDVPDDDCFVDIHIVLSLWRLIASIFE